jgi:hypothetical protein
MDEGKNCHGYISHFNSHAFLFIAYRSVNEWPNNREKILGIRVISLDGGEATLGQYIYRWIVKFLNGPFSLVSFFKHPYHHHLYIYYGHLWNSCSHYHCSNGKTSAWAISLPAL